MPTFNQSLTRIRRFLRDPDAVIWDSTQIAYAWNETQLEFSEKIGFLERLSAFRYPPLYTWSYLYEHEKYYTEGDVYLCFKTFPAWNIVVTYPWEPGYDLDSNSTADDGYRLTHPWESGYGAPGDPVRIPLHETFLRAKFVAWDEGEISPISENELAASDQYYKTKSGDSVNYYRPDENENSIVIYPRPSVTWDDSAFFLDDPSDSFSDTLSEGIVQYSEEGVDDQDYGIIWDSVNPATNLFMVWEATPVPIAEDSDTWDDDIEFWPEYMVPMIEYGTLERLFGADTDGFIPSLRDYWKMRKEMAILAVKALRYDRLKDREMRMGGIERPDKAYPKLPSKYPVTYP